MRRESRRTESSSMISPYSSACESLSMRNVIALASIKDKNLRKGGGEREREK